MTHWPTTHAAEFHASSTTGRHARTCHPARLRRGQQFNKGSSTTWVILKFRMVRMANSKNPWCFAQGFRGWNLPATLLDLMSWANSSSSSRTSLAGSGVVQCLEQQPAGPETVLIGVHIVSKNGDFTTVPCWFDDLENLEKFEARFLAFHRHRCNACHVATTPEISAAWQQVTQQRSQRSLQRSKL